MNVLNVLSPRLPSGRLDISNWGGTRFPVCGGFTNRPRNWLSSYSRQCLASLSICGCIYRTLMTEKCGVVVDHRLARVVGTINPGHFRSQVKGLPGI